MIERRRRLPRELGIVKFISRHQAAGLRFVSLGMQVRAAAVPLWRDGLIEIWYRQLPEGLRGPHYSLSFAGRRLAAALGAPVAPPFACSDLPAPRGFSGAEG